MPDEFNHRVDLYAEQVRAGDIVAGPYVRLACQRHRQDREKAEAGWIYQFSKDRADNAIEFFETVLRLPDVLDERGRPKRFDLMDWQAFIVGSLFGWIDKSGHRRFREAYIEIGKGNGKTVFCAGIGLYGLVMDGERAAEIYAAASDQAQAHILFRDAVRIAQASPDLDELVDYSGGEHIWQIDHKPSLSFFKTFSRESGAKSGPRPHMGLLDELHEQTPQISIKIRAGAKSRRQPLFVEITNSGFDRTSICWEHHEHSRKIVEGALSDDQWFSFVAGLDEGDDPLTDATCHIKANPGLGTIIQQTYLDRQVALAKHLQGETNTVLRLNFCVWTNQDCRPIDMQQWQACKPLPTPAELLAAEYACGCLDLGETDDMSAWGRLWFLRDDRVAVKMQFYLPESALERYPDRPYAQWKRSSLLTVTSGKVTNYEAVRADIIKDYRADGLRSVFYDPKSARETAQVLEGAGLDMVEIQGGFGLNEAIKRTMALVTSGDLCHGGNEMLTWMASNLVLITGLKGEYRIAKERASEKIDGMAALIMGIEGGLVRRERAPAPQYQILVFGGR